MRTLNDMAWILFFGIEQVFGFKQEADCSFQDRIDSPTHNHVGRIGIDWLGCSEHP